MNRERKKGFVSGFVVALALTALLTSALATTEKLQKELEYRDITITLDGKTLDLKDSKGSAVEPFMMEGSTYLPVRALAEGLGLQVSWDGASNAVVLKTPQKTPSAAYTRSSPAPLNTPQSVIVKDYVYGDYTATVTVTEVLRGDQAWQRIRNANSFNAAPESGQEYLLAWVKVTVDATSKDSAITLSRYDFKAYSGNNATYKTPTLVLPSPVFSGDAFSGGTLEGWTAWQVAKEDSAPKLVFGQGYDGSGGIWHSLAK